MSRGKEEEARDRSGGARPFVFEALSTPIEPTVEAVRRLCRALGDDAGQADDIAQDAWLAALRKRIPGRELSRWLLGAARRLVRSKRREEARRVAREHEVAREEALPSALDSAAHIEAMKRVVAAVEALEEPFRTALVLRYFEDLPPGELARRLAIPVNTARSRVRRGIERMREHLGPESLIVLVPLEMRPLETRPLETRKGPRLSSPIRDGVPAGGLAGAVGALAVLGLVAAGVIVAGDTVPSAGDSPVTSPAAEVARLAGAPGPTTETSSSRRSLGPEVPADATDTERESAQARSALEERAAPPGNAAEVRGRLTFEGGRAAQGMELTLSGFAGSPARALEFGVPGDWTDPRARTGPDGGFSFRFGPPRAFDFQLDVSVPGHALARWYWHEILPGDVVDLCEIELSRGAVVEGRLLDAPADEGGKPILHQDWTVYAASMGLAASGGNGREESQASAAVDQETGTFRVVDVQPGKVELEAYSRMASFVAGPTLELFAGETTTVDLVHAGPDDSRRITVTTLFGPLYPKNAPDPAHVELRAPDGSARTAGRSEGTEELSFDDLSPGLYSIEIDDPRFLFWRQDGVAPGTAVSAQLTGSAGLVLHAVDAETRDPLDRFAVRIALASRSAWPREYQAHDGEAPLPRGRLEGLAPGDYVLTVLARGFGPETVDVVGLAPGETRTIVLELGPGSWVSGRVRTATGAPAPGVVVLCLSTAAVADSPASPILRRNGLTTDPSTCREEIGSTETDERGSFRFVLPRPGGYVVYIPSEAGRAPVSQPFRVGEDEGAEGLELFLPAGD